MRALGRKKHKFFGNGRAYLKQRKKHSGLMLVIKSARLKCSYDYIMDILICIYLYILFTMSHFLEMYCIIECIAGHIFLK